MDRVPCEDCGRWHDERKDDRAQPAWRYRSSCPNSSGYRRLLFITLEDLDAARRLGAYDGGHGLAPHSADRFGTDGVGKRLLDTYMRAYKYGRRDRRLVRYNDFLLAHSIHDSHPEMPPESPR